MIDQNLMIELIPLGGTLSLTCNYMAVPAPTVEWLFNGSLLNVAHPRISQTDSNVASILTRTSLTHDEGGNYSCVVTNSRGSDFRNVTVLILSEC